jgi:hypothetical protein
VKDSDVLVCCCMFTDYTGRYSLDCGNNGRKGKKHTYASC